MQDDALCVLVPILEDIVRWDTTRIRALFEAHGLLIHEWDKVRTDWLSLRENLLRAGGDAMAFTAAGA